MSLPWGPALETRKSCQLLILLPLFILTSDEREREKSLFHHFQGDRDPMMLWVRSLKEKRKVLRFSLDRTRQRRAKRVGKKCWRLADVWEPAIVKGSSKHKNRVDERVLNSEDALLFFSHHSVERAAISMCVCTFLSESSLFFLPRPYLWCAFTCTCQEKALTRISHCISGCSSTAFIYSSMRERSRQLCGQRARDVSIDPGVSYRSLTYPQKRGFLSIECPIEIYHGKGFSFLLTAVKKYYEAELSGPTSTSFILTFYSFAGIKGENRGQRSTMRESRGQTWGHWDKLCVCSLHLSLNDYSARG